MKKYVLGMLAMVCVASYGFGHGHGYGGGGYFSRGFSTVGYGVSGYAYVPASQAVYVPQMTYVPSSVPMAAPCQGQAVVAAPVVNSGCGNVNVNGNGNGGVTYYSPGVAAAQVGYSGVASSYLGAATVAYAPVVRGFSASYVGRGFSPYFSSVYGVNRGFTGSYVGGVNSFGVVRGVSTFGGVSANVVVNRGVVGRGVAVVAPGAAVQVDVRRRGLIFPRNRVVVRGVGY